VERGTRVTTVEYKGDGAASTTPGGETREPAATTKADEATDASSTPNSTDTSNVTTSGPGGSCPHG